MAHTSEIRGVRLTKREKEVLEYLVTGYGTRQIAGTLEISEHTVYHHRKSILRKKGVRTCKELIPRKVVMAHA